MMKRLSLLLAALFVAATLFAAPVIASGNGDSNHNNNDKVCVLRHGDDNGKDYHWVWDVEDLHIGDKVVEDHFCEDDHNGNGNGDHNGNHDDHNGDEG